jgi:alkanesulfonate monooxygenase SsuD/methylene tetrahydromethanopterin reductase-like flavin-dependent oxidoreductase (luciferase family)
VLPVRDPVLTAKQATTLDVLSAGRCLVGVGIGAYREEFEALRPDLVGQNRGAMLDEGIQALQRLFAERRASFRGRFVHFEEVELFPKAVQQPLPLFLGGHNPASIERAVRWGQGWLPGWRPFGELGEWIARLRAETGDEFPERVTAFREGMAVHGRYGQPCPVCGAAVQRIRYASNETNYCARCQTGGRLLADRALSRLLKQDWPRSIDELD